MVIGAASGSAEHLEIHWAEIFNGWMQRGPIIYADAVDRRNNRTQSKSNGSILDFLWMRCSNHGRIVPTELWENK